MSTTIEIPITDTVHLKVHEGSSRFSLGLEGTPGSMRCFDDVAEHDFVTPVQRVETDVELTNDQLLEIAFQLIDFAAAHSGRSDFSKYVHKHVAEACLNAI